MKHPLTKMAPPVRALKDTHKTETPQQRKTGIKIVNPVTQGVRLANTDEAGRPNKSRS